MNTLEDKLSLLSQTKKDLKLTLGIKEDIPFSNYIDYIPFTPYRLFTGNKVGVWLDPSDLSTMYQDIECKVPVTKNGDPVAFIADKSKGLFGNELVKNGFNNWAQTSYASTLTLSDGVLTVSGVEGKSYAAASNKTPFNTIVGKMYFLSIDVVSDTTGYWLMLTDSDSSDSANRRAIITSSGFGKKQWTMSFIASSNKTYLHVNRGNIEGNSVSVSNLSIKEFIGNHASQPVASSRPLYRTDGVLHWITFDGVDDYFIINTINIDKGSFAFASKNSNLVSRNSVILSSGMAGYISIYGLKWSKNDGGSLITTSVAVTQSQSIIGNIDNTLLTVRDSKGATGSATGSANLHSVQYLFSFSTATPIAYKGDFFGLVLKTDNLNINEQDKILNYLDRKLGDK